MRGIVIGTFYNKDFISKSSDFKGLFVRFTLTYFIVKINCNPFERLYINDGRVLVLYTYRFI